jgi:pilus assembly protein CpaB
MRLVFGLVLLAGLGLAGFAVYMAQDYINQYEVALAQERKAREEQVPLTEIYVAAAPLRHGQILKPEDVRLIKFPQQYLPEGAFTTEADLFPNANAAPRMVKRALEKNEPILAVKVTEPGRDAGVTTFLAEGMRAFTINVDVSTGVSGFINPSDRVDVYWTGDIGGRNATKLIQSGVKVLAIDQSSDIDRLAPAVARTVTVEVTPRDVAALTQAQSSGRLTLALMGAGETELAAGIQVDQRTLLGIEEVAPVLVEKERVCTIKTRRGADLVDVVIPCND